MPSVAGRERKGDQTKDGMLAAGVVERGWIGSAVAVAARKAVLQPAGRCMLEVESRRTAFGQFSRLALEQIVFPS